MKRIHASAAVNAYSGIIRNTTMADLLRVTAALGIGVSLIMMLRMWLHADSILLPLRFRDLITLTLIAAVGMCGLRVIAKEFYDLYLRNYSPGGAYEEGWCADHTVEWLKSHPALLVIN